jgi:hypothetical protein
MKKKNKFSSVTYVKNFDKIALDAVDGRGRLNDKLPPVLGCLGMSVTGKGNRSLEFYGTETRSRAELPAQEPHWARRG